MMSYDEHRNTIMAVKFKSAAESLKAMKGLDLSMKLALSISEGPEYKRYPCSNGQFEFSIIRKGEFILIESVDSVFKTAFVKSAEKLFK